MNIPDLTQKAGPLPIWGWAVAVAGGLWFARYRVSGTNNSVDTNAAQQSPSDISGGVGVGGTPAGWISQDGPAPVENTTAVITTNDDWAVAAEKYLLGKNYDPFLVDTAIRRYISGDAITDPRELAIISAALAGVGPVPVPLPPITAPKPYTPPGPIVIKPVTKPVATGGRRPIKSTTPRKYTVKSGDTLAAISQTYYGTPSKWRTIYNANLRVIHNPNKIYAGQVIVIP